MLDEGQLAPEQTPSAPQRESRGRVAAAVGLLALAALLLASAQVLPRLAAPDRAASLQAHAHLLQARVVMELAYWMDERRTDASLSPRLRRAASSYADLAAISAADHFTRAAAAFTHPPDRTAAAASAAALHAYLGDQLGALRTLQGVHRAVELEPGAPGDLGLTEQVVSFLVYLYAGRPLTQEWLQSEAAEWIPRRVPAHLLIQYQVAKSLDRPEGAEQLRQAMHRAGARTAARVLGLLGAASGFILLGVVLLGVGTVRGFGPYAGLPPRPWGVWAGLQLAGAWLVLTIVLQFLFSGFAFFLGQTALIAGVVAAYALGTTLALAWFAASVAPPGTGLRSAGWRRLAPRRVLTNGLGAYAAALPLVAVLWVIALRLLPEPPLDEAVALLMQARGGLERGLLLLLLCVVAPIAEETVFRGGVYGGMRQRWGMPAAALASSVLFALVHLNWVNFGPILLLGVALCVVYERTGSLLPGMVAHGVLNLGSVLAVFLLGGGADFG